MMALHRKKIEQQSLPWEKWSMQLVLQMTNDCQEHTKALCLSRAPRIQQLFLPVSARLSAVALRQGWIQTGLLPI
jgi:hypothetical protein